MSDIVERLKGKKPIDKAKLDRLADGADEVTCEGKTYRRRGPKDQLSQPGPWREVKEGMDDADSGEPLHVSGPGEVTNPAAEAADALEQAAQRLSGFIDRRANANNPELAAHIQQLYRQVSDLCAKVEGVE
jgi:hypothetical protein